MKVIFKSALILFLSILLFSCEPAPTKAKSILEFIPENSLVVFKIDDFEELKSDIKTNSFLSKLKKTQAYSFFSENEIFNYLKPSSKSIICISEIDSIPVFTFIAKQEKGMFLLDFISDKSIEKVTYEEHTFQKITSNEQSVFTLLKDSVFIASNSQQNLQLIADGHIQKDVIFSKISNLKNNQDFTAILPANALSVSDLEFNFASWAALDIEILPDAIFATGVVLSKDSIPQLISVFKDLQPQKNDIAKVTPTTATTVVSFTFNDFDLFAKNLQNFRGIKSNNNEETALFEAITEVSKISLPEGNAMVIKSIDTELTKVALDNFTSPKDTFKTVAIYDFNKPDLFENQFLTFTNKTRPTIVFQLEDFFIFSENEAITQQIINSFLTNDVLSKTTYYKEALSQLSDESSLLIMELNGNYSPSISKVLQSDIGTVSFKKYPLAVLQFSYERNFAHVNFVCKEASSSKKSTSIGKVAQIKSIKLEHELLNNPKFFSNHRTGGKDIVVQDVSNTLYFISANGKILWTKKLKNPILGEIKEIDILRNGKKQLAFATQHRFYVLDRTGRAVAPFPIKFNDEITQPLSVFDYDNNRKYRFIITQGKEVLMLNNKGKTVKGFTFKKTKSNIVFAPQHFRIQGKDYIVIAENNGKLNIVSRTGKPRISISKKFNFSTIPPTLEAKKIVIIDKDNSKNSIGIDGKVSVKKLNVSSYQFTVNGKTKVTLDDNLMRINGILIELPFGIYTGPKIFHTNRKSYISITETQENKVYLYTTSGTLFSGFPVFGTSSIDLGDATKNGNINFVTKGGTKEVLIFEVR